MKNMQYNGKESAKKSFSLLLVYIIAAFIAFGLYFRTSSYEISGLDDDTFIKMNFSQTSVKDVFTKTIFLNDVSDFYRPVLSLSFMTDNLISSGSPYAMHTTNVLLHVLSCLLILFFLKRYYLDTFTAFLAAVLFAVHPVNVFSVAWIPGRNDILLFLFFILSLIFFMEYAASKKIRMVILHFLALTIALFTKETAVLIPAVCAGFYFSSEKKIKPYFVKIFSAWIIIILFFLILHLRISSRVTADFGILGLLGNSYKILFDYYAGLYFFKAHFSSYTPTSSVILGIAAVFLSFIFSFFSNMKLSEKIIYFFIPLAAVSVSLFAPQGFYQANRLYVPLFFVVTAFVIFLNKSSHRKAALCFLVLLCIAGSFVSFGKIRNFQNGFTFLKAVDEEKPGYNANMANLYSYQLLKNGHFKEASEKIKALAAATGYKNTYNLYMLSVIYMYERKYLEAAEILESIVNFDKTDILIKLHICYNLSGNADKSVYYYDLAAESCTGGKEKTDALIKMQEGILNNVKI